MPPAEKHPYDALLLVSFGGPEGPADVLPFLENVLRGRNVPRERLLEVAEHYQRFGGVSPLNAQNRALLAELARLFDAQGPDLKLYFGNRNWHPLLEDTLGEMQRDGIQHALALVTSAYSSYSGCRQYREDIARAQERVGPGAPAIDKLRPFFNHPGFIEPLAEIVRAALRSFPESRRDKTSLVLTAHSIPMAMARGCDYVAQLEETSRLVAERVATERGGRSDWKLVFQSRSGPPSQPWLEPDISDYLTELHAEGVRDVVIAPVGFLSDHIEVLYDLDICARERCQQLGMNMARASTVGTHPRFVEMIRQLVLERTAGGERLAVGKYPPRADVCAVDCCLIGR